MTKKALILVDIQNDFMPGGALAVKNGDQILPVIKALLALPFNCILATKDWHPLGHFSFATTHHKNIGDHVDLNGTDQILWPEHCVQGTPGAEFSPGWDHSRVEQIFHKGTRKEIDSYSTFFDNQHLHETGLEKFLKDRGIAEIYLAGLATDFCVKFSTLDALTLGFKTYIIQDGCRAVNLKPGDDQKAFEELKEKGAKITSFKELEKLWPRSP